LSRLKNVHAQCIERNGKVVFLHRIVPGGADRSYGIQVAELAGLPKEVITRAKQLLTELEKGTPAPSNTGASPDSSGQLSLFDPLEIQPATRETAASSLTSEEQEVLEAVRKWDLMNKTPFECMQFLHEIKQKLN
jgi:DNA mismatch repair protein MutS